MLMGRAVFNLRHTSPSVGVGRVSNEDTGDRIDTQTKEMRQTQYRRTSSSLLGSVVLHGLRLTWATFLEAAEVKNIEDGNFPHRRRDIGDVRVGTVAVDLIPPFAIRGRSPALAKREPAQSPSSSVGTTIWPTYAGNVPFPTKLVVDTTLTSAWFSTATQATPIVTAAPSATIPCSFKAADPDGGVDHGGCECTVAGKTTEWPILTFTPSGTHTVWGTADYCRYTTAPPAPAPVTTDASTSTNNCQACTRTGGPVDVPTCTTVPACKATQAEPTFAAWVANRKLDIGDASGTDEGKSLAQDMIKQLSSFCNATECDTGKYAKMSNVETVIAGAEEDLKPQMVWETAHYSDQQVLQEMLVSGLATWTAASSKMCEEVTYQLEKSSGTCGAVGPIPITRRDNTTYMVQPHSFIESRCLDCGGTMSTCDYNATICSAPDLITVVKSDGKGNPYANMIDIRVDYGKKNDFDAFLCELIVEGLTGIAMALFPEFLPAEELGQLEFETFCGDLGDLVNSGGS